MVVLQTVLPFFAALVLTLALGSPLVALLRRHSARQHVYEDAPKTHAVKTGTPTMGGLLFLPAFAVGVWCKPDGSAWALALLGSLCAMLGSSDDLISILRGRNRGLRALQKLALSALAGIVFLGASGSSASASGGTILSLGAHALHVPHAIWYALALLAIVATTHAVNLTDGLDGLAAGAVLPPLLVLSWLGWRAALPGVASIDLATAGAALGFLAFNRHPAKVIMGDTGALALGGVLAGSAILTGNLLLLPLIGGVFAAETLSVILQVASFKTTGKRIFRMSPLHHHFELGGWPETKVTGRFWTASALLSLVGAAIAR
jgi:phospho-N-acetylmuramoyl-pentapeptide-transferase